ncbi:hypothetical protein QL285_054847 [Trifolium repens]|nr:hypothetical protein QL285_054847 [Trifolium repens]
MILTHTIFGKPVNDTAVTKEELFILLCVSQGRPVNLAMLANFVEIVENTNRRICIGGFVTLLARAISLHTPLEHLVTYGAPLASGFRYMDIPFCFDHSLIGTLGPASFQLVINHAPVHDFTLPNLKRTNIHDKKNWLCDLKKEDETDLETPPFTIHLNRQFFLSWMFQVYSKMEGFQGRSHPPFLNHKANFSCHGC